MSRNLFTISILVIFMTGIVHGANQRVPDEGGDLEFLPGTDYEREVPVLNEELRKLHARIDALLVEDDRADTVDANEDAVEVLTDGSIVSGSAKTTASDFHFHDADYDSGWKPDSGGLAADTLLTLAHGLSSIPRYAIVHFKGSLVGGNADGGDPTVGIIATIDDTDNGASVNWDSTNVYVKWVGWAARIKDDGEVARAVTNASTDLQFRVFAWK